MLIENWKLTIKADNSYTLAISKPNLCFNQTT